MKNQIIISGKVASGKTTVGKALANRLNYDFTSMGQHIRKTAAIHKMSIAEYQKLCVTNPSLDQMHDGDFRNLYQNAENIVIDYRLGFHFFHEGFKVFLDVSDQTAIKRLKEDPRVDEHHCTVIQRNELFKLQFQNAYNIENYLDLDHYDLIIKVDDLSVSQIVDEVLHHL